ncbi:MAG TPA: hypothetical protein VNZ52_02090, partial [Candidatus Thermoplasmatota archaeon]|nr:hypothetical protein [Candidatus Thermoplasmatota archaeon]
PVVPALFGIVSLALALNALYQYPLESIVGVGLLLVVAPFYWLQQRANAREEAPVRAIRYVIKPAPDHATPPAKR